jgi:hypothetical protein
MALPLADGASLSQESLFNPGQLIPDAQSYPRVEDNSPVPPLKSISPMATDPLTLSPLPPPN